MSRTGLQGKFAAPGFERAKKGRMAGMFAKRAVRVPRSDRRAKLSILRPVPKTSIRRRRCAATRFWNAFGTKLRRFGSVIDALSAIPGDAVR